MTIKTPGVLTQRHWVAILLMLGMLCASAQAFDCPDPKRFEEAMAAFDQQQATSPQPENGVLFVGSSSVRFWNTIHDDLAPLTIVHRGFGGSNMHDALYYIDRAVIRYRPRAVVLYEGDNDISANGMSPALVMENFNLFVEKLRVALPQTRLYVLSIKPSIARWDDWALVQKTNGMLAARCAELQECVYIDVATPMLGKDGKPIANIFVEDDLHMNAEGYKIWTGVVKPILLEHELTFESQF